MDFFTAISALNSVSLIHFGRVNACVFRKSAFFLDATDLSRALYYKRSASTADYQQGLFAEEYHNIFLYPNFIYIYGFTGGNISVPLRVVEEWFATCGGCEVSLIDLGESLLDLLSKLELVHFPALMDHKLMGQTGKEKSHVIPDADLGIITGSIRMEEHREIAQKMREKCGTIIALGTCACYGGIPSLGNMYTSDQIFQKVYHDSKGTVSGNSPSIDIPHFSDRVYALDEVIKVDTYLPGCPPPPRWIAESLGALINGRSFSLPERSICDDCGLKRDRKVLSGLKRPLDNIMPEQCFLELGYLCLGPVTRAGCSGEGDEKDPRCIRANMPCRGCFGPVRKEANPVIDMMGALSTIGLSPGLIPDRVATLNRFIGAKSRLKPKR